MSLIQLYTLTQVLLVGLRSGKDWAAVVNWLSQESADSQLRSQLTLINTEMRVVGQPEAMTHWHERCRGIEEKVFVEIIRLSQKGLMPLTQSLENFRDLMARLLRFEDLKKSVFILPLIQCGFCVFVSVLLAFVLPFLFPNLFKSFIFFGRWDLVILGLIPLGLGCGLLLYCSKRSQRLLRRRIHLLPFLSFLRIRVQSGDDFQGAWAKVAAQILPPGLSNFTQADLSTGHESFKQRLRRAASQSSEPWDRLFVGFLWCYEGGVGLADFLADFLETEADALFSAVELQMRKDSLLSLLPLVFLCLPATLFLAIGPHFYELSLSFGSLTDD